MTATDDWDVPSLRETVVPCGIFPRWMETAMTTTLTTARVLIPGREVVPSWEELALPHRPPRHLLPLPHQEGTPLPANSHTARLPHPQRDQRHHQPLPLRHLPKDTLRCRRQPPVRSPRDFGRTIGQASTKELRDWGERQRPRLLREREHLHRVPPPLPCRPLHDGDRKDDAKRTEQPHVHHREEQKGGLPWALTHLCHQAPLEALTPLLHRSHSMRRFVDAPDKSSRS